MYVHNGTALVTDHASQALGLTVDAIIEITISGEPGLALAGVGGDFAIALTIDGHAGLIRGGLAEWTVAYALDGPFGQMQGGLGDWATAFTLTGNLFGDFTSVPVQKTVDVTFPEREVVDVRW